MSPQEVGTVGLGALELLAILWMFWGGPYSREIKRNRPGKYMIRHSLRKQSPKAGAWRAYLHQFFGADDEGCHNHPWKWSLSIVLWGSYTEERLHPDWLLDGLEGADCSMPASKRRWGQRSRRVRWFNLLRAGDYHRISELHPRRPGGQVWTLFITGPFSGRSWGFWIPGRGHVHWKARDAERREEARRAAEHAIFTEVYLDESHK